MLSPQTPSPPPGRLLLAAALTGSIALAYLPALSGAFLWDDDMHIAANPAVSGSLGFGAIWSSAAADYFPLTLSSFWAEHALWGLNPFPYHLVTLIFHLLGAVTLWRVLVNLNVTNAWLGAALWALHPVQVESVAWICELKNTQSGFFFLLAVLLFLNWDLDQARSARGYFLAIGFAMLAILSKASAVMLPAALGVCLWWRRREFGRREIVELLPFCGLSALAAGWTIWEQRFHAGALGAEWSLSWPQRLIIAGRDVLFYAGKLAWPHPLSFIYLRWSIDPAQVFAWTAPVVVVAGFAILWLARNTGWRPVFAAATFFLAMLFPVLGFFRIYFFRYSFVADHFQYLASMAPLALAAAGLSRFAGWKLPWLRRMGAAGLILGFGILTFTQCFAYSDNVALFESVLAHDPDNWMATYNLGIERQRAGHWDQAIACYQRALSLNPADPNAENNLGLTLAQSDRPAEALSHYQRSVALKPDFAAAWYNRGLALATLGRTHEAVDCLRRAISFSSVYPDAWNALGACEYALGRQAEAMADFQRSLGQAPENPSARRNLAGSLWASGRKDAALKVDPSLPH